MANIHYYKNHILSRLKKRFYLGFISEATKNVIKFATLPLDFCSIEGKVIMVISSIPSDIIFSLKIIKHTSHTSRFMIIFEGKLSYYVCFKLKPRDKTYFLSFIICFKSQFNSSVFFTRKLYTNFVTESEHFNL